MIFRSLPDGALSLPIIRPLARQLGGGEFRDTAGACARSLGASVALQMMEWKVYKIFTYRGALPVHYSLPVSATSIPSVWPPQPSYPPRTRLLGAEGSPGC